MKKTILLSVCFTLFMLIPSRPVLAQPSALPAELEKLLADKPMNDDRFKQIVQFFDTTSLPARTQHRLGQILIDRFDEGDQTEYQARSRQLLGTRYIETTDYDKATKWFLEGLLKAERYGHTYVEALCHNGLGIVAYYNYQFEEAAGYWRQAADEMEASDHPERLASLLTNIGATYFARQMEDSALIFHERALDLAKKNKDAMEIASAVSNIGTYYYRKEQYPRARDYFRQALTIMDSLNNKTETARALVNIGSMYQEEKNHTEALEYYQRALPIALLSEDKNIVWFTYESQTGAYAALGRYKEAYESQEQFFVYYDSTYNKDRNTAIQELKAQYESEKKEQEIALLTRDRELAESRLSLQRILLWGALLLLLVTGGLAWSIASGRRKSDQLLLNILPAAIVEELKETGKTKARRHERVSVLFADFVDFTQTSEEVTPERLVDVINRYFSAFDHIVEKHGLEKIKTIGDAYMCAAGLNRSSGEHALSAVSAAREMMDFVEKQSEAPGMPVFRVRIGIHSGPVVAGVVGKKKFAYDIWGDTVNTAARMEQHSFPGEITLSERTYALVRDQVACIPRGMLQVKGKGKMEVYTVM